MCTVDILSDKKKEMENGFRWVHIMSVDSTVCPDVLDSLV